MKIAVPTLDGSSVSRHFGRSAGFVIFEVEDKQIKSRETRMNQHTPHAQGLCHGEHQEHGAHGHNHESIVGLLRDCEIVLCGGMGAGAAQALAHNGIRAFVVPADGSPEEVVARYLQGASGALPALVAGCGH